jgi:hypothetical protein
MKTRVTDISKYRIKAKNKIEDQQMVKYKL